eukprot:918542_1
MEVTSKVHLSQLKIMNTSSTPIQIRVLAANTGVCYPISLLGDELTIQHIQRHLAAVIPARDQILLLGPPYKVPKDSSLRSPDILSALQLGDLEDDPTQPLMDGNASARKPILATTEKSGSRRLFLFSKQALTDSAPDPTPCHLSPHDIHIPTVPDPSPILYDNSPEPTSPLHQALSIYERRFMLHVCQGKAYADGSDLRLEAARNCILEQAVMVRALRAAVSNLSDHWNNAARTRAEFTSFYLQKMDEHGQILNSLEGILEGLSKIGLHHELKAIARMNGRVMETLLDTVPVERERKWAGQCQTAYATLQGHFEDLKLEFEDLVASSNREEEGRSDLEAETIVKDLDKEVEDVMVKLRCEQGKRSCRLTEDHKEVVGVVLNALQDDDRIQAAFTTLETMSKASTEILPSMEKDDSTLKEVMIKVADAKTVAMTRINTRLRQISQAQRKIQRVLKTVSGLRAALGQQCENMTHVEHLVQLPAAYNDFLSEIKRRLSYGDAVTSISTAMFERLTTIRGDEVKSREKFLQGSGRHLMPSFFEMFVPTLATQPPSFTPQLPAMVELDSLPRVDTVSYLPMQVEKENNNGERGDVNTDTVQETSSLTESLPRSDLERDEAASTLSRDAAGKGEETPASIIVTVDEQSGDGMILCSKNHTTKAEIDAERKTLAYENATLRQALERLGGKSPQSYIDDAKSKDKEGSKEDESCTIQLELDRTKEDLDRAMKQLDQTNAALIEIKTDEKLGKVCDKISHSNFRVGDVALFMPTGRGSAGKRTYLAFHSNCPHRYLSTESIGGNPDYVLGRIIYQEELVAGAIGKESNPHGLLVGTKFWILTVEVLKLH